MRLRIDAYDLPGRHSSKHRDVHVGLQRRGSAADVLGLIAADAPSASWECEVTALSRPAGLDLRGAYVQGPPGARFLYLSWGTIDSGTFTMFGRSKLLLAAVPPAILESALATGTLLGTVGLLDERGRLRMAAIKPPAITWTAA